MQRRILLFFLLACGGSAVAQPAVKGKPLPAWQEGYMDLHHINTGRGNAAFYVLPDGTTLLFDAGELDPTNPRTLSKRNTPQRPNGSLPPYAWIAAYIKKLAPAGTAIDYAVISHFHDDHFGSWYPGAPISADGSYALTGITGVGSLVPIRQLLTRDYHYPVDLPVQAGKAGADNHYARTWSNYLSFIASASRQGMTAGFLRAGSPTQLHLLHHPAAYPGFQVRVVKSNGWIWTGSDSAVTQHFPPIDSTDRKTWPDENALSNVLLLRYGPFSYYTGGDCPGNVFLGDAPWRDVETPVAKAAGPVDVATMDHHGNRDALNGYFIKTLQPRVWIEQVWTADHPGHEVLIRATTPYLYAGPRDLFATNMMEANELVIGPLVDQAYRSKQGHIVVRVMPGGKTYYVIILDDSREDLLVKDVFGPYMARGGH